MAPSELEELDYFWAIASVVHDTKLRSRVMALKDYVDFRVPFDVFADIEGTQRFLRGLK